MHSESCEFFYVDENGDQIPTVRTVGSNEIITNKRALMVLQCEDKCPDVFRVIDSCSSIKAVPPSIYTAIYIYDLEENGLPKNISDYERSASVNVSGAGEC